MNAHGTLKLIGPDTQVAVYILGHLFQAIDSSELHRCTLCSVNRERWKREG